jgi:hypothetical protein
MIPHAEVTAISLEFGTMPPMEVFQAMQAENWLHHHGGKNHPLWSKNLSPFLEGLARCEFQLAR